MNPDADPFLDALFTAARRSHDIPADFGFETRLLARIREERRGSLFLWSWRLTPYFAALVAAGGVWLAWDTFPGSAQDFDETDPVWIQQEHMLAVALTGEQP
jgi:hypothetical protein